MKLPSLFLLTAAVSLAGLSAADYELRLPKNVTRPFVAPEIWTTPMMDWQVANGRVEMVQGGPGHDVQLLTHQLKREDGSFRMSVRLGELKDHSKEPGPGMAGFKFAVTGAMPDEYRSGLFGSQGLMAGITTEGRLFVGKSFSEEAIDPANLKDLTLVLEANCVGDEADAVIIAKAGGGSGEELGKFSAKVKRDPLMGNVGLVCQPLPQPGKAKGKGKGGRNNRGRGFFKFWFQDWAVSGSKLEAHPKQTFGPILWSQYTVHEGAFKLTAQFAPVGADENQIAKLEIDKGNGWEFVDQAKLDPLARTAEFRMEYWDDTRDTPYRILFDWESGDGKQTDTWRGTVRKNPSDQPVVNLAALSCMVDYAFPNQYIAENLHDQDPDILFFAGDQIYEGVGGFGVVRTKTEEDIERATLSYLSKYWLFGWSFRDVLKNRPSVIIPDDHDVFHGNIWGKGGHVMPEGGSTSSTGGYNMHPTWVNMVQRTQTSHLPDPYDPTPVKNGIGVYYTNLNLGGISFAILEDRKFKSAPGDAIEKPVGGSKRLDHVADPDYDTTKLDKPGLVLLGERQLKFLDEWTSDYEDGVQMKAVLSQSPFCSAATTHGGPNGRLAADMDANGWPQTGRNKAHRIIRKAHAIMIHGDQHLATLVHHGVDDWNDSGWSYAAPGIANGYKRLWDPLEPGVNRQPGYPKYTGEFLDGFRNKITVWAAANRVDTIDPEFKLESDSMVDKLNSTGSGYGIIKFDKKDLSITVESWPVYRKLNREEQFNHEGWPKTLSVEDQYGRKAAAHLPEIDLSRFDHPLLQVTDEKSGEVIYTRRVTSDSIRPKVFDPDVTYTVTLTDGKEALKEEGLKPKK